MSTTAAVRAPRALDFRGFTAPELAVLGLQLTHVYGTSGITYTLWRCVGPSPNDLVWLDEERWESGVTVARRDRFDMGELWAPGPLTPWPVEGIEAGPTTAEELRERVQKRLAEVNHR